MRWLASFALALALLGATRAQERVLETNGIHVFPDGIETGSLAITGASSDAIINVRDPPYNARCDGVTDNYAGLQAAVYATQAIHGTLLIPGCALSYRISSAIILDDASLYLTIRGDPTAGSAIIRPTEAFAGAALFDFGTDGTDVCLGGFCLASASGRTCSTNADCRLDERLTIEGLSFSGRKPSSADLTVPLLRIRNVAQFRVTGSSFSQSNSTTGAVQLSGANLQVGEFDSNVVGSTNLVGLYIDQGFALRVHDNLLIEGRTGGGASSHALYIPRGGPGLLVHDNHIDNWEGTGIKVDAYGGNPSGVGEVSGNDIMDVGGGISVQDDKGTIVSGNRLYLPKAAAAAAISVSADDIVIANNQINWSTGVGISHSGTNGTVQGNQIRGATVGIDLNGAAGVLVASNKVWDSGTTTTHGVRERNGADSNRIVGNDVTAGTTARYTIIGASTVTWDVGQTVSTALITALQNLGFLAAGTYTGTIATNGIVSAATGVTIGTSGGTVTRWLTGSLVDNLAAVVGVGSIDSTVTATVTGAADGDACIAYAPNSVLVGVGVASVGCYVSAANTVKVRASCLTSCDAPSATYRVLVLQQ